MLAAKTSSASMDIIEESTPTYASTDGHNKETTTISAEIHSALKGLITKTSPNRLIDFINEGRSKETSCTDVGIQQTSTLLGEINQPWEKVPRTNVILRTIGYLDFLDEFIDLDFSDYWFPLTERRHPDCLRPI